MSPPSPCLHNSLVSLPSHVQEAADLLRAQGQGQQKASALKTAKACSGKEARVGPVIEVDVVHGDGQSCRLQLQVRVCGRVPLGACTQP
jgi:hypothetical protein